MLKNLMRLIGAVTIIALFALSASAEDRLYINVGRAEVKQSPLALTPFTYMGSPGTSANQIAYGKRLFEILEKDLNISSYFSLIAEEAFVEDYKNRSLRPKEADPQRGFDFTSWQQIGAEFLVRGGFRIVQNNIELEAYLYHVPQRKLIMGKSYSGSVNDVRDIAHKFANEIVKNLTGRNGFFTTKFVASRSTEKGEKEIFIMDWDGANTRAITQHRTISQSPAWSPDGRYLAYTSFLYHRKHKSRNADLFLYDLKENKRFLLSYQKGLNSSPTFLPDSSGLLYRITERGFSNSDIFKIDLEGKNSVQLTHGPRGAMNVEPAVSPDGRTIAFSSDRSGRPMIYTMDIRGQNVKRMTYAGVYNSAPAWSPDGKTIAFAGHDKDHFDIFVMDADGKNIRRLTSSKRRNGSWANNEYPSFSPDGRYILFTSDRTGRYQLHIVSVDGKYEHRLTFDNKDYYIPRWSPYLD